MMRIWTMLLRLLGVLVLAALVSAGWLFREDLLHAVRPGAARVGESLGLGVGDGRASPETLARARDKVDSLHAWHADSVVIDAGELAALISAGLPRQVRARLDSIEVALGDNRITLSARLETARIPGEVLGPLAGALEPWEPVSGSGPLLDLSPGRAGWRVEALTVRGFTLPPEATTRLIEKSLPGAEGGVLPVGLPDGIRRVSVSRSGVALFPENPK